MIETRYIDLDYRSEYSTFYSKAFRSYEDSTHRVHFFQAELSTGDIDQLPENHGYLGFMILRPQVRGVVGRTMLRPPPALRTAVRTGVQEEVHFFGQPLTIRAAPFIQQDAQVGSCAHAAAWMCHYSAYRGGRGVSRRTIAEFSQAVQVGLAPGRLLPSTGLSVEQISSLLEVTGLPPLFYDVDTIGDQDRPPAWRPRAGGGISNRDAAAKRLCCRYLNSALPVLAIIRLAADGADASDRHAMMVCGYTRHPDDSAGVTLIVNDDRRGPYLEAANVDDDVDPISRERFAWDQILAPVPDKLWMSGDAAERHGCTQLLAAARRAAAAGYDNARQFLDQQARGELTIRTYAITNNRFKERVRKRYRDQLVVQTYSLARLPRYVWVVEAIDRDARKRGRNTAETHRVPCVAAEIIFDATSGDLQPHVLALRLPGLLSMPRPDNPRWGAECGTDLEPSGGQYDP